MKPIIFLDVDGVLNPSRTESPDWKFDLQFQSSRESGGWELTLSSEMARAIMDLGCEIRWLTTWIRHGDDANPNIGAPLGWPRHRIATLHLGAGGWGGGDNLWKPRSVHLALQQEDGPPIVWIDDDAAVLTQDFVSTMTRFAHKDDPPFLFDPHGRLLMVTPDDRIGLSKKEIGDIQSFLRRKHDQISGIKEKADPPHSSGDPDTP